MDEISTVRDEAVFQKGDACHKMVFLKKRYFTYLLGSSIDSAVTRLGSESSQLSCTKLGREDWLCEAALWVVWTNRGDLQATTGGTLIVVSYTGF